MHFLKFIHGLYCCVVFVNSVTEHPQHNFCAQFNVTGKWIYILAFLYVLGKAHVLSCHVSEAFATMPLLHFTVRECRLASKSLVKIWLCSYNSHWNAAAVLLCMMTMTRALFSQNQSGKLKSCKLLAQSDWWSWLWVCWVPVVNC